MGILKADNQEKSWCKSDQLQIAIFRKRLIRCLQCALKKWNAQLSGLYVLVVIQIKNRQTDLAKSFANQKIVRCGNIKTVISRQSAIVSLIFGHDEVFDIAICICKVSDVILRKRFAGSIYPCA